MLELLGKIIEKKPWFVVAVIILITIGFSLFIPALEFKTDFNDFTPEDEIVQANTRVFETFGSNKQIMLVLAESQKTDNILDPSIITKMNEIQQNLQDTLEINATYSITTFIDTVCQVEFGKTLNNCTAEQIAIAVNDLFLVPNSKEMQLFIEDDPNEKIDYNRFPRISKGKTIDSIDIKNCYLNKDENQLQFSIEVYDLSGFESSIKPPIGNKRVMEWYIDFENSIKPDEQLDIKYRISAHLEPKNSIWEVGQGLGKNLFEIIQNIRNRELLRSYKTEVYLWVKPPKQTYYFPILLNNGSVNFNIADNKIEINVQQDELRNYGITPQFGTFELPAKISEFSAGFRYYQTPLLNRAGGLINANFSSFISQIGKLQNRPILGSITERIFQRFIGLSWEDLDELFEMMEQTGMAPERIALQDMDNLWINLDSIDTNIDSSTFYIESSFLDDLRINALSFISKDYPKTQESKFALLVIELPYGENYEEMIKINTEILKKINDIDKQSNDISFEITGEGIISMQINELTTEVNQFIGPGIFIIIMIILFINFRRTSYVILPMVALAISTIWLFGTMALLGIAFNIIAIALIPLIMGLGVDYSVHIFHNYRAELENGRSPAEAIKNSVRDIGTAMFLAMITTVIAFMSFLSASIPPIREFGILLSLGVAYTFITAITLLASLRYLLDKNKKVVKTRKLHSFSIRNIMGGIAQTVLCHQKKILIAMIIISLIFSLGAIQIKTGFDMNQFVPEGTPAVELIESIAEEFPYSSQDQEYILIEGNVATVATLKGIASTHDNFEDDTFISRNTDGSIKTTSVYLLIQQAISNNQSLIKRFNIDEKTGIPKTDRDVQALFDFLYVEDINLEDIDSESFNLDPVSLEMRSVLYRDDSAFKATLIRVYIDAAMQSNEEGEMVDDLVIIRDELNEDITSYGSATAIATGNLLTTLKITHSLTESQILSTVISLLLAAIVVIIAYRNLALGLIAMIPVGFSILWILGTIYYLGYQLNVLTVTVTSITIGIGIDYAIHATERFRLVADKTGDVEKAVCETISHTGGALFIAAMTTVLGFGILVLTPIPPQQQFGQIVAVTILYSFLTSVFILPLILVRWGNWRKKKKGYIISPRKYNGS